MSERSVILPTGNEQLKKPPVISIGFIGWLRENLQQKWMVLLMVKT